MLSNPTNNLQNRQRQHRRQQSTPTAFEAVKVTTLPHIQRQSSHRRGMSLDQRRRQTSPQGINTVSSTNNQGYQTTQQHILRETQQQRLARPGQQYTTFDNDENYLMSPLVNNHRESFDAGCTNEFTEGNLSPYSYTGTINTISEMEPSHFNEGQDFNLFSTDATLTPSEFIDFSAGFNDSMDSHSGQDSRRSSLGKRISGGIVDRVTQFENLTSKSPQRPLTPPNQNSQGMSSILCY
jgi:regulatory protein SWI5